MSIRIWLPFAALLCGLTAGCGLSGTYPSLAPRPQELGQTPAPKVVPSVVPAAPDPALGAQLNRLLEDARAGEAAFRAALPAVERAVARAGAAGSDSWAEAQQSLSRLESARTKTTVAAAELEALNRARVEAAPSVAEADLAAVSAAADQVRALVEGQDEVLDRLSGALGRI